MLKCLGSFSAFLMFSWFVLGCGSGVSNTATNESLASAPIFSVAAGSYAAAQTVSLSSSTPGAQIYYTIDGSTPTSSSTRYTAPITVSISETIQALAIAANYGNSPVSSAAYAISPSAAAPTFAVPSGRYSSAQSVALSSSVAGASIYYTTDGTTPTTSSTLYAAPITVSVTETIEAIAVAGNYTSPVISVAYVIQLPVAGAPVFSVAAGTYTSAQTVTLSSSTPGAQIYYTTNGSTPTIGSTLYSGPLSLTSSETVKAIAVATSYSSSAVASAAYVVQLPAAAPVFSIAAGTYTTAQMVAMSSGTPGAQIYFTTDGSNPTTGSTLYGGPMTVNSSETIKALAVATNYSSSAVTSAVYVINSPIGGPLFSVPAGTYDSSQMVDLYGPGALGRGAPIYYTTDGSTPTTSSNLYRQTLRVSSSETIRAFADTSYGASGIASATYVINLLVPAAPVLSVSSGTYSSPLAVVMSSASAGVPIYYTTDGSTPTAYGANLYQEPFVVSTSETVRAAAITSDSVSSPVTSAAYVISAPGSLRLNQNSLLFFRPGEIYTTTLTNPTAGPVTINSIQINPNNWTQVSNCGTSLAANSSCIIAVKSGQSYGQFVGTLAVQASDSGDAHAIPLISDIRNLYVTNLGNGLAGQSNPYYNGISGGVYEETLQQYQIYFFTGMDIEGQSSRRALHPILLDQSF